jgi:diaminobutyrate-2-oxoglutarate transaminase
MSLTQTGSSRPENEVFVRSESNVRSYARSFPAIFTRALGSELFDGHGRRYLDFLAGAGSLNYGHNNP